MQGCLKSLEKIWTYVVILLKVARAGIGMAAVADNQLFRFMEGNERRLAAGKKPELLLDTGWDSSQPTTNVSAYHVGRSNMIMGRRSPCVPVSSLCPCLSSLAYNASMRRRCIEGSALQERAVVSHQALSNTLRRAVAALQAPQLLL